jgi:membrane protein YdbS with pleckstrin-like domain
MGEPMNKPSAFPEWQRLTVLAVTSLIIVLSLFSIYSAAANWTSLPSNMVVALYFFVMLVVVPLLAIRAFIFAFQEREPRLAMTLTAIPAAILIVRAVFVGGV